MTTRRNGGSNTAGQARVGVVGPCTSGKSTLITGLLEHGIPARHIAQEHSYVPHMWKVIANPSLLIFLDVSFHESQRRKKLNWNLTEYQEQHRRLAHARAHAHLYLMTDSLSIPQVLAAVLDFLRSTPPQ